MRRFRLGGLILLSAVFSYGYGQETQQAAATHDDRLTLQQAISRALANEPNSAAALAIQRIAVLEKKIARTALLPTATYHNQVLYTEPNGVPTSRISQTTDAPAPVFIANNAVREHASQGVVDEKLGLGRVGAIIGPATSFKVNPQLAARLGFNPTEVAEDATSILNGVTVNDPLLANGRPSTIRVRLGPEHRQDV